MKHILITGSNRSGTTWVGEILRLDKKMNYIYEPFGKEHLTLKKENPFHYHFHYVTKEETLIAKEYLDCCFSKNNLSWSKDFNINPSPRRIFSSTFRKLKSIYELTKNYRGYIIKDPLALFSTPWLYENYHLDILIIIRHPAAYVNSIKRMNWRVNPRDYLNQPKLMDDYLFELKDEIEAFEQTDNNIVEEAALRWKIYHHVIKKYQNEYPDWYYIKHETISENPLSEFKKIFYEFNLEFDKSTKVKIIESTTSSSKINRDVHILKRDSKKNIKKWKTQLSSQEIDTIKYITKDVSKLFYNELDW